MNFRTTIILIAILAGVSIYFFLTRDEGAKAPETETSRAERSLIDVKADDVTRMAVSSKDGRKLAFEKRDGQWRMTQPSDAAVETFQVDSLVREITNLSSRGQVDAAGQTTGLASPRHTVELTGKDGNTVAIAIGEKSALGDHMYVRVGDSAKADVVSTSIYETLEQPATKFRKTRLVETPGTEIKQITIGRDGEKLALRKNGNSWEITEPRRMPADSAVASDLAFAIAGLTASDFATESAAHGLDQPVATIWFSTEPPTTQPAATQPTGTTIRLGKYDDILRKNVFASVSSAPDTVIKVPAAVLESFDKSPLDIRDKDVLELDEESIQRISIRKSLSATTQPTTRPASQSDLTIERRVETRPATTQATTGPTTEPVVKWAFPSAADRAVDPSKLDPILKALNPLRATKFLEQAPPTTQPVGTYVLTVVSGPDSARTEHQIHITEPAAGGDAAAVATYNDLVFEIERSLVNHLNEDLAVEEPANSTP